MLPCLQKITKPIVLIDSLGFSTEIIVASENKRSGHIFVSENCISFALLLHWLRLLLKGWKKEMIAFCLVLDFTENSAILPLCLI